MSSIGVPTDAEFKRIVRSYWRRHGRHDLPWRKTENPYHILVSEIMLQQTQVSRVIDAYRSFLKMFPSFRVLARATSADVLRVWQGLGYNRRALMLQRCAIEVVKHHKGALPNTYEALCALPGIGPYTAGAILAFAFNIPRAMIETNIRRVYLHHFFPRGRNVPDTRLIPIIERTLDRKNPRAWYSALMDYGAWLATQMKNPNTRSKHYMRQSKFDGSDRQIRGAIVRLLVAQARMAQSDLVAELALDAERVDSVLRKLEGEQLIQRCHHRWCVHNPHWSLSQ